MGASGMGRGLGKFAEGLMNGYVSGQKMKREKEEHDLRMQRAKDEQAMGAEIKKIADMKVAPTAAYVVTGEDGTSMTFGDAQAAAAAAQSTPGAQVAQRIMVGTKQYDDMEDAKNAAEAMNSPMAKSRMMADIGAKYNRKDVYDTHMNAYNMAKEVKKADMMQVVAAAEIAGKPEMALEAYNSNLPNGIKAELTPDGTAIQFSKKGQPVGQPSPIGDMKGFFHKLRTQIDSIPGSYFETWRQTQGIEMEAKKIGLQERGVAAQEKESGARVKESEARVNNIPVENRQRDAQIAASQTSAAAGMMSAENGRLGLTLPVPMTGVDKDNQVVVGATQRVQDPKTKQWGLKVLPTQTLPGMQPTGMATMAKPKPGEFDFLRNGTAPGTPQYVIDASLFPKRNLGQ